MHSAIKLFGKYTDLIQEMQVKNDNKTMPTDTQIQLQMLYRVRKNDLPHFNL